MSRSGLWIPEDMKSFTSEPDSRYGGGTSSRLGYCLRGFRTVMEDTKDKLLPKLRSEEISSLHLLLKDSLKRDDLHVGTPIKLLIDEMLETKRYGRSYHDMNESIRKLNKTELLCLSEFHRAIRLHYLPENTRKNIDDVCEYFFGKDYTQYCLGYGEGIDPLAEEPSMSISDFGDDSDPEAHYQKMIAEQEVAAGQIEDKMDVIVKDLEDYEVDFLARAIDQRAQEIRERAKREQDKTDEELAATL